MNKATVYFFIDESGDKGYSNSSPNHKIGVMAGFLINDWVLPSLEEKMESGLSKLNLNPLKKLHMSELDKTQQAKVIELIRNLFIQFNLKFFYSVIYTSSYTSFVGLNPEQKKESMHSQLLQNILIMALSLCTKLIEKYNTDIKLQIVSDNIDSGVLKRMKKDYSRIVNFLNGEKNKIHITKNEYIESQITNLSHDPRPKNGKFEVDIRVENSAITFISDVLSYTTFQHLIKFMQDNPTMDLNTLNATSGHPLEELLIFQYPPDIEDINLFGKIFGPGREN
ncbi:DUF3800 domain-containing protein [Pluralibacter gergoviae]|uniref:DUF3800 domain-containing protein n=2 Tax=Pluralibacter gergoviae TaxID=61647 RepID=UPI000A365DF9|nr:DUF3800 domain-containing protein [Pluralibacter gergoviae]EKT9641796.1 DUF3800 domain-containing protein [Pluralibacter gergoviae]EKV3545311.1 DUF3800 domain-containing protein [Pluralibacter gergoviae]EKV9898237.1 DUF3800 domain-containing protein [Pluralibacter gergoviae]EMD1654728.1 DUF3800 domain-containing protein [Pluralibacter gergoviae]OUF48089.1 hypothetical protein AZ034_002614 [Pluralibacter gergoviae]